MPDILPVISESYFAQGLSTEGVEALCAIAELRQVGDGEAIMKQYDESTEFYILMSGDAVITSFIDDAVVATIGAGAVLGEIGLIDEKPRSATVRAKGPCEVIVLDNARLRALMESQPQLGLVILKNLAKLLCDRLRISNRELATLNVITGAY